MHASTQELNKVDKYLEFPHFEQTEDELHSIQFVILDEHNTHFIFPLVEESLYTFGSII